MIFLVVGFLKFGSRSANNWWERSPNYNNANNFCNVNSDGSANNNNASNTNGIAPFGYMEKDQTSSFRVKYDHELYYFYTGEIDHAPHYCEVK